MLVSKRIWLIKNDTPIGFIEAGKEGTTWIGEEKIDFEIVVPGLAGWREIESKDNELGLTVVKG